MEGIGLESMLGAEEVEKLFSDQVEVEPKNGSTNNFEGETSNTEEQNEQPEETAEVDFSDFLGNQPEGVGRDKDSKGVGGAPESSDNQGTPNSNPFSSIAKALRDEGVFPDLSDEALNGVIDAATLRKLFEDQAASMLDETQKKINNALNGGATPDEVKEYQTALSISKYLEQESTLKTLKAEGSEGENLRKQVMYQDYMNRGFKHERAMKLIQKSIDDMTDVEDAKEALESCKEYYQQKIEDFQEDIEDRKKQQEEREKEQYSTLKKKVLDTENFYGNVKVDKAIRQKAYDSITKPVFKDENGNYMTALQKYQREKPLEFMINMAMMMALTDDFTNVEKLTRKQVQKGLKKGFEEIANQLNNTRRTSSGSLDLANTAADSEDRSGWTLA